jgi:hypothetical protein
MGVLDSQDRHIPSFNRSLIAYRQPNGQPGTDGVPKWTRSAKRFGQLKLAHVKRLGQWSRRGRR